MDEQNDVLEPDHAENAPLPAVAGMAQPGAAVAASEPEWKASEDGNIVERAGKKYVREEALHAERERAKSLSATLAKIEPLVPEFTEFLNQRQTRNNRDIEHVRRPAQETYADEDDLRGLAIVRGYYKADGVTPDIDRANAELNIMARVADRSAAKHVAPVRQVTTQDRANANYREALQRRFTDGEPLAEEQYIRQAFDALPEEYRADPNIANITSVIAVGLQTLEERKSGKRQVGRREPMFREGSSRPMSDAEESLDALGRAAARARGKTPEQWAKMTKAVGGPSLTGAVLDEV